MKGKALLCLAIVLSMALTLIPARVMAADATMEVIFQDTGTNAYIIEDCSPPVADILVDLKINNVVDMWGWSTSVSWNPDVLQCEGKAKGPFNAPGTSLLGVIDNEKGEILTLAAGTMEEETISDSGVVCTLTFTCIDHGTSRINLTDTMYIDYPDNTAFPIADSYGLFECKAYVGPPRAPVATFTPETSTQFTLDKETGKVTVDFDACASVGSYDPLPDPGTENPIIGYSWDFDGDLDPDYTSMKLKFSLYVENIENYLTCDYFMGWNCRVEWDRKLLTFIDYEKGPFPDVDGGIVDTEGPEGVIQHLVFGVFEEVLSADVTGSGVIAYLYFSAETLEGGTLTITESTIVTYYYDNGDRVWCEEPYTPQFEVLTPEGWMTPECTASWTYDGTYPGSAIDAPVTLWIYAPDRDPSETHPDFVAKASVTNTIHILPPVMGPDIDVYTEKGGEGKGCDKTTGEEYGEDPLWTAMSDAFGPQEEVTVCAKITYNDEPVENKLVAFEIVDPEINIIAVRSGATNSEGIACVTFRIPWTGVSAEELFGAWLIVATVDIAEETVMDKCRFRYGYIVSIIGIDLDPTALHKDEVLTVTVTLANIAFTSKDVVITVVLYDECGVPINHFGTPITVDPVSMIVPTISLTIPTWAFVGTGTVYVNVFDTWPYVGGTPMCPEGTPTTFVILNT